MELYTLGLVCKVPLAEYKIGFQTNLHNKNIFSDFLLNIFDEHSDFYYPAVRGALKKQYF